MCETRDEEWFYCAWCAEEGHLQQGIFPHDQISSVDENGQVLCPIHDVPLAIIDEGSVIDADDEWREER